MQITFAAVMSVDGRLTLGPSEGTEAWRSVEDRAELTALIRRHQVLVMGGNTYRAVRGRLGLKDGGRRIVMTAHDDEFTEDTQPGVLEFTDEPPKVLIGRLKHTGCESLALLGGPRLLAAFLEAGLIDEFQLVLEPYIFGSGKQLLTREMQVRLKLLESRQLNDRGTLLLRYAVV
jgi:dihydrofolate reductase